MATQTVADYCHRRRRSRWWLNEIISVASLNLSREFSRENGTTDLKREKKRDW